MPRIKWTEALIEQRLRAAVADLGVDRMPTARELRKLSNGNALAVKVSRTCGGFDGWAERMGLQKSQHASRKGWRWEAWVAEQAKARGLTVEQRGSVKQAWDLLINGHTVDVKMANPGRHYGELDQWTFRIATEHRCDFYVLVAVQPGQPPIVYVVPESHVPRTTITICCHGARPGRYAPWRDRWDLLV